MSTDVPDPSDRMSFRSNREIAIHVSDLARARAFYADVMGFRVVAASDDGLELDTGALRLYVNRDPRDTHSFIPSFDVADRETARRHLEANGCTAVPVADGAGPGYFRDPFGFVFDVIERA